jgi:hypothetical protein
MGNNAQKPIKNTANFDDYLLNNHEIDYYFGTKTEDKYFGIIYYKNKNVYHGHWKVVNKKIILDGYDGKMNYSDGTTYVGEWLNNDFNGYGKMELYSGAIYEGEWKNGKRNGTGTMIYEDGTIIKTKWIDGVSMDKLIDKYHFYNPNVDNN